MSQGFSDADLAFDVKWTDLDARIQAMQMDIALMGTEYRRHDPVKAAELRPRLMNY